jgi:tetrahydromethanopterin S-methyltransferase subunit G
MPPGLYTQEQLEEIFRRRMADQADLIGKVAERAVEKIRPEFIAVNSRLDQLTEQVRKTNGQVLEHSGLIADLGVEGLSQEEREALPEVLVDHVRTKQNRADHDNIERRQANRQQFIATFISMTTGIVIAILATLGFLRAMGVIH